MSKKLQQNEQAALVAQQNNYIIYVHINKINHKAYVGQTNQIPQRRWGKDGKGYSKQAFYNAIQKYGWDNFEHIILERGLTQEEANQKEKEYIQKFNSYEQGYNATTGGQNRTLSQEEKDKISNFMSTTRLGEYNPNAKAIICLNTHQQFNTIKQASEWCNIAPENISRSCKTHTFSGTHPQTKEILYWCFKENYTDEIQHQFDINKTQLTNRKAHTILPVEQIDLKTGEVIAVFNNCREAAEKVFQDKNKGKGIARCASGQRNTAYGFVWRYRNE